MKKNQSIVLNRRKKILEHLNTSKSIKTEDLADVLNISPLTIRRDFQALEAEGIITRYHGGAKLNENYNDNSNESVYEHHSDVYYAKRKAIAKEAANKIDDGDTIFINSSSTALLILDFLKDKRVVVVTNNGKALQCKLGPNIELLLTGGEVYGRKQSMVGDFATLLLSKIAASKCFLGVSGIDSELGLTTSVLKETLINKEMITRCKGPVYVLASSDKIGKSSNFSSGEIDHVSNLITDSDIDSSKIEKLKKHNVEVTAVNYK